MGGTYHEVAAGGWGVINHMGPRAIRLRGPVEGVEEEGDGDFLLEVGVLYGRGGGGGGGVDGWRRRRRLE